MEALQITDTTYIGANSDNMYAKEPRPIDMPMFITYKKCEIYSMHICSAQPVINHEIVSLKNKQGKEYRKAKRNIDRINKSIKRSINYLRSTRQPVDAIFYNENTFDYKKFIQI